MTLTAAFAIGALGIVMLIVSAVLNRRARHDREGRPTDMEALRTAVLAAVDRDDLIEAVKIYRRETGARLLEATDAVQRIASHRR
jgi:ribosomal protein L7/L12